MRFATVLIAASACLAHDLYLKVDGGRVEFHNGDSFPQSEGPPVLERVRDAKVVSAAGEVPLRGLKVSGKMAVAELDRPGRGYAYVVARTIPNFLEMPAAKFEEYLGHEGLQRWIEWRKQNGESGRPGREIYSKYVKSLTGSGDGYFARPVGMKIEFVPLEEPGKEFRVRLLVDGKPAGGHEVELQAFVKGKTERRILGNTDAGGVVRVPAMGSGFYKLHAIVMERRTSGKADWESFWATLTWTAGGL